ncbi:MAG TPA: hypothetical protein VLA90_10630 [Actinomycetota bacterium]|nr:hypothetical protein [Actinomycetota bacterium]
MCLTCGCGEPHDDHGNPDLITYEDLKKAADASGISIEEAANNITTGLSRT